MPTHTGPLVGVLLAAGAGRRAGGPKALRRDLDGRSWLVRSIRVLTDGGCDQVVVVLGASASTAEEIVTGDPQAQSVASLLTLVEAPDWADGMGASLRVGLAAASRDDSVAALVHLVDLPDVSSAVVARLRSLAITPVTLARATYDGRPGHPVVFGRAHLAPVGIQLAGDEGARDYLAAHQFETVECGDLATGEDRNR